MSQDDIHSRHVLVDGQMRTLVTNRTLLAPPPPGCQMTDHLTNVIPCSKCGERFCTVCAQHWADCGCPGPHQVPDPMARDELVEVLENNEALLADGFEDALIGWAERFNSGPVALYDRDKCIQILMERDGMDEEGAVEFFEHNVIGSWVGDTTPIYARLIRRQK